MQTLFLIAAATAVPATLISDGLAPGDPAPDFALEDLDGEEHRLTDLRGRIVVVEWTNHTCPAVAAAHGPRLVGDTRAAVADDVVWLQIDSSWFARELEDDIRLWRARLGIEGSYLLDPGGAVARAYGAVATPSFFVIDAGGRLAYRGALCDQAAESERRNHVLEAIHALQKKEEVAITTRNALGCTLKLAPPSPGVRARDYDEEARAHELYNEAARAAAVGSSAEALELIERSCAAGLRNPMVVLSDSAFREIRSNADARNRLRGLLGDRPARGWLTLVDPTEPGEAFVLFGTVRGEDGAPIRGATISLYHTDARGWYAAGTTNADNPRLFGRLVTDANGRYRIRTVFPAHYADTRAAPSHVHIDFRADGYRTHGGHAASAYFADDAVLTGATLREVEGDGCAILTRTRNAEGAWMATYDVTLKRE